MVVLLYWLLCKYQLLNFTPRPHKSGHRKFPFLDIAEWKCRYFGVQCRYWWRKKCQSNECYKGAFKRCLFPRKCLSWDDRHQVLLHYISARTLNTNYQVVHKFCRIFAGESKDFLFWKANRDENANFSQFFSLFYKLFSHFRFFSHYSLFTLNFSLFFFNFLLRYNQKCLQT